MVFDDLGRGRGRGVMLFILTMLMMSCFDNVNLKAEALPLYIFHLRTVRFSSHEKILSEVNHTMPLIGKSWPIDGHDDC